jgi:hypothetical protein
LNDCDTVPRRLSGLEARAGAGLAAQHVELITKNKDLRFHGPRKNKEGRTLRKAERDAAEAPPDRPVVLRSNDFIR